MSKRAWISIALVAALTLIAGAVPALSAETGAVAVSVTVQAPAAPCLTVTPGSASFGTLPFSTSNISGAGLSVGNNDGGNPNANITINFCGTATGQNLLGSTTEATSPSGTWTPLADRDGASTHPCPTTNLFYLLVMGFTVATLELDGTNAPVLQSNNAGAPPAVFPRGNKDFRLVLLMPCQGSNGAGETKTFTATFTAVIP